jgi:hypothetical protein
MEVSRWQFIEGVQAGPRYGGCKRRVSAGCTSVCEQMCSDGVTSPLIS